MQLSGRRQIFSPALTPHTLSIVRSPLSNCRRRCSASADGGFGLRCPEREPDGPERLRTLAQSGERTENQLVALIEALRSGAATDGAGTPIDSAYIATHTARELTFARAYLTSVAETQDLARRGLDIAAAATAPADSLKTVLRARYAQALIAASE